MDGHPKTDTEPPGEHFGQRLQEVSCGNSSVGSPEAPCAEVERIIN
jgi:hypothetical protein